VAALYCGQVSALEFGQVPSLHCAAIVGVLLLGKCPRSIVGKVARSTVASVRNLLWGKGPRSTLEQVFALY
jgi:hypothetical protein